MQKVNAVTGFAPHHPIDARHNHNLLKYSAWIIFLAAAPDLVPSPGRQISVHGGKAYRSDTWADREGWGEDSTGCLVELKLLCRFKKGTVTACTERCPQSCSRHSRQGTAHQPRQRELTRCKGTSESQAAAAQAVHVVHCKDAKQQDWPAHWPIPALAPGTAL